MSDPDDIFDPETGGMIITPEKKAVYKAEADRLVARIPALRGEVEAITQGWGGDEMGPHVTYGNTLPDYLARLAEASPRDEAEIAWVSAFLEELAAEDDRFGVAELSVIESILSYSPAASRLFIAERGGPHTRRLAESCAERWDLRLEALWDPTAPRDPDGRPVRSDPRWQRRSGQH